MNYTIILIISINYPIEPFLYLWNSSAMDRESPNRKNIVRTSYEQVLNKFWPLLGRFYGKRMEKISQQLRRIILLHLGLITSRFGDWTTRKPHVSWFLEFRDPWESLFVDLHFQNCAGHLREKPIYTGNYHLWENWDLDIFEILKFRSRKFLFKIWC